MGWSETALSQFYTVLRDLEKTNVVTIITMIAAIAAPPIRVRSALLLEGLWTDVFALTVVGVAALC